MPARRTPVALATTALRAAGPRLPRPRRAQCRRHPGCCRRWCCCACAPRRPPQAPRPPCRWRAGGGSRAARRWRRSCAARGAQRLRVAPAVVPQQQGRGQARLGAGRRGCGARRQAPPAPSATRIGTRERRSHRPSPRLHQTHLGTLLAKTPQRPRGVGDGVRPGVDTAYPVLVVVAVAAEDEAPAVVHLRAGGSGGGRTQRTELLSGMSMIHRHIAPPRPAPTRALPSTIPSCDRHRGQGGGATPAACRPQRRPPVTILPDPWAWCPRPPPPPRPLGVRRACSRPALRSVGDTPGRRRQPRHPPPPPPAHAPPHLTALAAPPVSGGRRHGGRLRGPGLARRPGYRTSARATGVWQSLQAGWVAPEGLCKMGERV